MIHRVQERLLLSDAGLDAVASGDLGQNGNELSIVNNVEGNASERDLSRTAAVKTCFKSMDEALFEQGFAKLINTRETNLLTVQAVKNWLRTSEMPERFRINPYQIAAAVGRPVDDIVAVALTGVESGLFDLHWQIHCPYCNMITEEHGNFFELTGKSNCKMCEVDFESDFLMRVEVTFSLNRAIEDIGLVAFCRPPPVLEPKINLGVAPGDQGESVDIFREPGLYRYFCPVTLSRGLLTVKGDPTNHVQIFKIKLLSSFAYDQTRVSARPGLVRFKLANECEKLGGLYIVRDELPDELPLNALPPRLTGFRLIHYPEYRRLFGDQALSEYEQLQVSTVALLFTDIAGSTALYETLGNAAAYKIVRSHFTVLFKAIETHGGCVVKTIGDAVMASFTSTDDAVRCAVSSLRTFYRLRAERGSKDGVEVKFGIHCGPALLVNLNGRIDYFGSTVNKAARVQGCAGANEVAFSSEVIADSKAAKTLVQISGYAMSEEHVMLKGIKASQVIFRLTTVNGVPTQDVLGF